MEARGSDRRRKKSAVVGSQNKSGLMAAVSIKEFQDWQNMMRFFRHGFAGIHLLAMLLAACRQAVAENALKAVFVNHGCHCFIAFFVQ